MKASKIIKGMITSGGGFSGYTGGRTEALKETLDLLEKKEQAEAKITLTDIETATKQLEEMEMNTHKMSDEKIVRHATGCNLLSGFDFCNRGRDDITTRILFKYEEHEDETAFIAYKFIKNAKMYGGIINLTKDEDVSETMAVAMKQAIGAYETVKEGD